MAGTGRQRPGPRLWVGIVYLALAALEIPVGVAEGLGSSSLTFGLLWLGLGAAYVVVTPAVVDDRGVRPAGQLHRIPWGDVSSAYTTTSPSREGQVGLLVEGRRGTVWVQDPGHVVLHRWAAATGRTPRAYGSPSSDDGSRA